MHQDEINLTRVRTLVTRYPEIYVLKISPIGTITYSLGDVQATGYFDEIVEVVEAWKKENSQGLDSVANKIYRCRGFMDIRSDRIRGIIVRLYVAQQNFPGLSILHIHPTKNEVDFKLRDDIYTRTIDEFFYMTKKAKAAH